MQMHNFTRFFAIFLQSNLRMQTKVSRFVEKFIERELIYISFFQESVSFAPELHLMKSAFTYAAHSSRPSQIDFWMGKNPRSTWSTFSAVTV